MKKLTLILMAMIIASGIFGQSSITVVAPNGGENWIIGCPALIQWTATNTTGPVRIDLFKNNMQILNICNQVPAGISSFSWVVPPNVIPGANFKVRVASLTSAALFDFSDTTFSINQATIQVSSPNGGETWVKGTMHPILWTDNICGNVRIDLWKGNQFNAVIATSVPSNGSFNWTIPNTSTLIPGSDYRVKITGLTNSAGTTGMVYDFSDSTFTISQGQNNGQVSLLMPNGGENWIIGCPNLIKWVTTSVTTVPVKLELFKNDLFYLTICPQVPATQSNFTWVAPWSVVPGGNYKVKITSLSSSAIFDFSDSTFSITRGSISLSSPNGGETWVKGTMHPIVWNDNLCDNVRIELWKGGVFNSVVATSVPSSGSFNWNIPNTTSMVPGNDYKIKIMSVAVSNGTTSGVYDISDSAFTILPGQNTSLVTLVTPNGGENWIMGCQKQIQWLFTGATSVPVKLELYRNDVFYMTICPQVPSTQSQFTWLVPWSVVPGNNYKVKVSTLTTTSVFDFSNGNFEINRGTITVVSPNGGESWVKGTMHPIVWNDNLCDNVRIELWKGGVFNMVIATSVPSSGTFNWNVPNTSSMIPGNDYKVKVMSMASNTASVNMAFDYSDSVFTILPGQSTSPVVVVLPNGGENWLIGCPNQIQWLNTTAPGVPVKIELYKNDLFLMMIVPQVPATQTTFTWVPPWSLAQGNDYKVKVTTLSSVPSFDFSDGNFSITRGTITVTSPSGGETWVKGTMHPITWTDNLCDNVRIELWKGSAMSLVIANSVPSNGAFNWMIPNVNNLVPGNTYKVKIIGMGSAAGTTGMVFDQSDSVFTIAAPGGSDGLVTLSLEKIYPNPCKDILSIKLSGSSESPVTVTIADLRGNRVVERSFNAVTAEQTLELNVSGLQEGNYLYVIMRENLVVARGQVRIQR